MKPKSFFALPMRSAHIVTLQKKRPPKASFKYHLGMQHVLSASQFSREDITNLFGLADELKTRRVHGETLDDLRGRMVYLLFYEPSTRTRTSFDLAVQYLGGRTVFTEAAGIFSSAAKGETLEDTIRVLQSYEIDAIIIRHKERGAAEAAAMVADIPIINAGDGDGEHPTQALLDLYTITSHFKQDRIVLAMGGDLKHGRTVRSLARLIIQYATPGTFEFLFCSPPELTMRNDILDELRAANIPFRIAGNLEETLSEADVFYQTRVQRERMVDGGDTAFQEIQSHFAISPANISLMKPNAIILHPLPRVGEISPEVDRDPRAKYLPNQTRNGLYIRMALLKALFQ
jgi:aspartate carbamoyltransferase catalytic subunit